MLLSSENVVSSFEENQLDFLQQTIFYDAKNIIILSAENYELDNIFQDFVHLKYVKLPNNICEIPSFAFKGCESLEQIEIQSELSIIGDSAFEDCYSLEHIYFQAPKELQIGHLAFRKTNLKEFNLSNTIVSIGNFSFQMCKNLQSICFKDIKNEECYGAFFQCYSLSSFNCLDSINLENKFKQLNFLECEI